MQVVGPRKEGVVGHKKVVSRKSTRKRSRSVNVTTSKISADTMIDDVVRRSASRRGKSLPAADAEQPPLVMKPAVSTNVDAWKPFNRINQLQVSLNGTLQPTEKERQVILFGEWMRYFHYYPSNRRKQPTAPPEQAFVYNIQAGRIGALFLRQSKLHSAVMTQMERKMFLVHFVDVRGGPDRTGMLELAEAKEGMPYEYSLLQTALVEDSNLIKTQRAPGTLSVFQSPGTTVRMYGEPFVYVRWVAFDEDNLLTAFLLSNGQVQMFVGDEYEIRWTDEHRKFLVRSNARCELIHEQNFHLMGAVQKLLHRPFSSAQI